MKVFSRGRCIGLVSGTLLFFITEQQNYKVNKAEEIQGSQKLDLPFPLFRNTARLQQHQLCVAICV